MGVPGRTQLCWCVTRWVIGTGPLVLAQGQCLAGAALLLPVQKPDNLDLALVWSLCSTSCCRCALRSCFYRFTTVFGFSLAGITTADKAKTLSCSCPEKWLWSRFSSGGLRQTRISASFVRDFPFLWLIAGHSDRPGVPGVPAAAGAQRYKPRGESEHRPGQCCSFVGADGWPELCVASKHSVSLGTWEKLIIAWL